MSDKELEPYGFGETLGNAIEKVTRLRQSHDRLLLALRDLVAIVGGLNPDGDYDHEIAVGHIAVRRAGPGRRRRYAERDPKALTARGVPDCQSR
jgi:hypothetical protein